MFHQHITERLILCLRSDDNHVVVVLGCGTNQGDTTYVNLFDDGRFFGTTGNGSLKRIEVNNDEVYFGDFIFFNLLHVLLQSAAAKNTSKNLRMQSLHASAQDGRVCSEVFHCLAGITQGFYKLTGSTG